MPTASIFLVSWASHAVFGKTRKQVRESWLVFISTNNKHRYNTSGKKRKTTISHFFIQDLEALRIISRFLKAVIRSKFNVFLTSLAVRGRMLQLGAT